MQNLTTNSTSVQNVKKDELSGIHEEFHFKFISQDDFNSLYKRVQRGRRDEVEKKKWDIFLKKKMEEQKKVIQTTNNIELTKVQCLDCYAFSNLQILKNKKQCNPYSYYKETLESSGNECLSIPVNTKTNYNSHNQMADCSKLDPLNGYQPPTLQEQVNHELNSIQDNKETKLGSNSSLDLWAIEYDLRKIEDIRSKMILSLENVNILLMRGPELSDKEDMDRIKLRSNEFSARFKRNYLYQVQCIMKEIEKMLKDKHKALLKENLSQKIINGHQSCLQALQIIEKHLPTIKIDSSSVVFKEFFMCISELTDKFKVFFNIPQTKAVDNILRMCENIMVNINNSTNIKPLKKGKIQNCPKKNTDVKKKIKDNLWMYSNRNSWHSKAAQLAKSKFQLRNQNINRNKETADKQLKGTSKCSNELLTKQIPKLNNRKRNSFVAEDEIKTMVEMTELKEPDNAQDDNLEIDVIPAMGTLTLNNELQTSATQTFSPSQPVNTSLDPVNKHMASDFQKKVPSRNQSNLNNIALIYMKSNVPEDTCDTPSKENNEDLILVTDEEEHYRYQFEKYKQNNLWYNHKILEIVTRMSQGIIMDTVNSVLEEVGLGQLFEELFARES